MCMNNSSRIVTWHCSGQELSLWLCIFKGMSDDQQIWPFSANNIGELFVCRSTNFYLSCHGNCFQRGMSIYFSYWLFLLNCLHPLNADKKYCNYHFAICILLKIKVKGGDIVFNGSPSQSYGASPAIWYHIVLPATRHSWTHLVLTPARLAGTWFIYPGGMEGWVDL